MTSTSRRALAVSAFALTLGLALGRSAPVLAAPLLADDPGTSPPPVQITEADVRAAEKAWGEALVAISRAYETGGINAARAKASAVLDGAYGYNWGPVLFKPTLTQEPQTFRLTKAGALAYFVGHDRDYPKDTGFALKHWRSVEVQDVGLQINGAVANTMGKVLMRDKDNKLTVVDKTWVFKKGEDGVVRIIVHHSSLPYEGPCKPCTKPKPKT